MRSVCGGSFAIDPTSRHRRRLPASAPAPAPLSFTNQPQSSILNPQSSILNLNPKKHLIHQIINTIRQNGQSRYVCQLIYPSATPVSTPSVVSGQLRGR
jgi:hypothetical protein